MRWLLIKDVQILKRSPLLVGLLVLYPIVIALMIGFALSSPPGKPKVAFYSAVAPGEGKIAFGSQQINVSNYASRLFTAIDPIKVRSRDQAIAKVRDGEALAALIVPADLPRQIQSLVRTGIGSPTVELILNTKDPLDRQFVEAAIKARLTDVEQAVSRQVLGVAVSDLQQVLNGGQIQILGQSVPLLGLRNSRTIVRGTIAALPRRSPLALALRQVAGFADLAIEGLGFASPVLGSIGRPLTVDQTQLTGKTTPTDSYAVGIAVVVSMMFLTMLLAAGTLAIEREEHVYSRLVRGLISPGGLLTEKIALSAACGTAVALTMAAAVSAFVPLQWSRFPLWILALACGALAFGALGVAIGGVAREVRAASLLAFGLALPVGFVALVPASGVSGALKSALDAFAFLFPFKPALQAAGNAFSGSSPGIGFPLAHLLALTAAFGAIARVSLRRFE